MGQITSCLRGPAPASESHNDTRLPITPVAPHAPAAGRADAALAIGASRHRMLQSAERASLGELAGIRESRQQAIRGAPGVNPALPDRAARRHAVQMGIAVTMAGARATDAGIASSEAPTPVLQRKLDFFALGFLQKYPQCVGFGKDELIATGPDGKNRRCGLDRGTTFMFPNGRIDGQHLAIGRTQISQLDMIYDAHRDAIAESIAEYSFDIKTGNLCFKKNGEITPSLLTSYDVFDLGNGKWMVPQREFRDCTHACEEMLLLEGKSASEAEVQLTNFEWEGNRRDNPEIIKSIERRTGRKAHIVESRNSPGLSLNTEESVAVLKEGIAHFGPCILSSGGHARILDAVETTPDGHVFTMRDPFHGSVLKVRNHMQFWDRGRPGSVHGKLDQNGTPPTPIDSNKRWGWTAVFLTKDVPSSGARQSPCPAH